MAIKDLPHLRLGLGPRGSCSSPVRAQGIAPNISLLGLGFIGFRIYFWGVIEDTGQQRCMPCCRVQSTFLLLAGTGSDPSPGLMCQNSLEARNPKPRGFEGGEFLAWRFVISVSPRPWSVFIGSQKPQPQTFKKEKRGPGKES